MALPLEGIRVLDLAQIFAGPITAMYLADLGAEVIKIERPGGEDGRNLDTSPYLGKDSKIFMAFNRNKRGIVLDLTKEAGREVLFRLVKGADVLIENFMPGVAERLGIGYDTLSQLNPRLIYAAISGFGSKGPYAQRPAYDLIIQGVSGIQASRRYPDGSPVSAPFWVADCSAPMLMAYGIMVALWHRERTGRGQKVETALLNAAIAMQATQFIKALDDPTPVGAGAHATYQPYRCADGRYINVVILNEPQWQRLCKLLEIEHLATDPRFSSVSARQEHNEEVYALLSGLFGLRSSEEWLPLLLEAEIPAGPVQSREEVFADPQVEENELFVTLQHPAKGATRFMGLPLKFSQSPGAVRHSAPLLGQHTDAVLKEAGYGPEEIVALRRAGGVA